MKILVVDDSLVYQSKIKAALSGQTWIQVVGTATNGQTALDLLDRYDVDLMTLDMEMPVLNGIETLKKLAHHKKRPKVIVFSSSTQKGSEKTMEALAQGANDFVPKPSVEAGGRSPEELIREHLLPKIRQFLPGSGKATAATAEITKKIETYPVKHIDTFVPSIVVMASSTGGPAAHDTLFRELKGELRCPILITQHMPPVFTAAFAKRINGYGGIPCAEAVHNEPLENKIYVAPGDYHMSLKKVNGRLHIHLDQSSLINSVRPAADPLFETAASFFGPKCMGFVLTGMGEDGLAGARSVKKNGGGIMIQDKNSCVVFGMPGAIWAAKIQDSMGPLEEIRKQLSRMVFK